METQGLQKDGRDNSLPGIQRIPIACANCARTKTKCDHQYPCGRCRLKGITCVPRPSRRGKDATMRSFSAADSTTDPTIGLSIAAEAEFTRMPPGSNNSGSMDGFNSLAPTGESQSRQMQTAASVQRRQQPSSQQHVSMMGPLGSLGDSFPLYHFGTGDDHSSAIRSDLGLGSDSLRASAGPQVDSAPSMNIDDWDGDLFSFGQPSGVRQSLQSVDSHKSSEGPPPLVINTAVGQSEIEDEDSDLTDLEHWSICRCNPLPQHPARDRAKSVIATLDHNFVRPGVWSNIVEDWRSNHFEAAERFVNMPLSDPTREWIIMTAQRFLRVAMDIHALKLDLSSPTSSHSEDVNSLSGYIRLPPTPALQNYLEIVLRNFEPHYPLIPARTLEPNKLAGGAHGRASSLLLFLMLAFGSMIDPATKARRFSTALTEICRHSLIEVLETNSGPPEGGLVFYCGLMFVVKSAFSGDKAHMNIGVAHRQTYLTYMRSSGMFKLRRARGQTPVAAMNEDIKQVWQSWLERESSLRLVYGWVMLEHEISLFYATHPSLRVSELDAILPADDKMWLASNADEWLKALCKSDFIDDWRLALDRQPDYSLRTLFQLLIDDKLDRSDYEPKLLHMRLLLYPIHVLVTHVGQLPRYSPTDIHARHSSGPITQHSSILRFEDIHILLQRWNDTVHRLSGHGLRFRAMRTATMALYHLTSLDLLTKFNEIERLAREGHALETDLGTADEWFRAPEHVVLHCGQVFRLLNEIEDEVRPVWSAVAIYRATMILWAFSVMKPPARKPPASSTLESGTFPEIAIDALPMSEISMQQYLRSGQAKPYLSTTEGNHVSLYAPSAILNLGIETVYHGLLTSSFALGVTRKLEAMSRAWEGKHQQVATQRSI
ncbi:hypothetical protein IFR05_008814 [Cadophora sp. M221]|nr:hypothetical protein IFR05_008814 [Cadophora sp. M221]